MFTSDGGAPLDRVAAQNIPILDALSRGIRKVSTQGILPASSRSQGIRIVSLSVREFL